MERRMLLLGVISGAIGAARADVTSWLCLTKSFLKDEGLMNGVFEKVVISAGVRVYSFRVGLEGVKLSS